MQKYSKKISLLIIMPVLFLLIFFMLVANVQADSAELNAGAVFGNPGSMVIIPIDLSIISTTTVSMVSLELSYDPAVLSFADDQFKAVVGDAIGKQANVFVMSGDSTPSGTVSISLVEMNDPLIGVIPSGQILKVKFNILSNARAGNTSIAFSDIAVVDKNSQKIDAAVANNAAITVNSAPSLISAPYGYIVLALFIIGMIILFFFAIIIIKKHFSKLE